LRIAPVPLTTSTATYDAVLAWLRRESASPGEIRVEDFLSAVRYDFPPPSQGALAIRTAAGPSPFGRTDGQLLQVGVQAAAMSPAPHSPVHLTIAVDCSADMAQMGRLSRIQRALVNLVDRLGEDDRITLIAFDAQARVLLDRASRREARNIRQAIENLSPGKGASIAEGLAAAANASLSSGASSAARRQMVVVTEAPGLVDAAARDRATALLRRAGSAGVQVTLLETGRPAELDSQLNRFAAAAGGKAKSADGFDSLRLALLESLTGRGTVVATEAQLRVKFNPEAVASYRLIGHEPTGGLVPASLTAELRAEQAATALFEVVLHPSGTGEVGVAELVWRDAATGRAEQRSQRISRLQFATSLAEAPISLQAAAIAAETAEILRGSHYAPAATHTLARVLEQADRVHPALQRQPEFAELMKLVELAEGAGRLP
jgi:Ca-activated chloride channel family protein